MHSKVLCVRSLLQGSKLHFVQHIWKTKKNTTILCRNGGYKYYKLYIRNIGFLHIFECVCNLFQVLGYNTTLPFQPLVGWARFKHETFSYRGKRISRQYPSTLADQSIAQLVQKHKDKSTWISMSTFLTLYPYHF